LHSASPRAMSSGVNSIVEVEAIPTLGCHAPFCAGHPRFSGKTTLKTWMAGTSPAMTRLS
jgi:hypothetical protein